jgi:hypothetical protein
MPDNPVFRQCSVAEPHHHYAAQAPGKNFDAAPAVPVPTLLHYSIYQSNVLKRTRNCFLLVLKCFKNESKEIFGAIFRKWAYFRLFSKLDFKKQNKKQYGSTILTAKIWKEPHHFSGAGAGALMPRGSRPGSSTEIDIQK